MSFGLHFSTRAYIDNFLRELQRFYWYHALFAHKLLCPPLPRSNASLKTSCFARSKAFNRILLRTGASVGGVEYFTGLSKKRALFKFFNRFFPSSSVKDVGVFLLRTLH